ncbi:hypothetical protein GOB15_20800 [Sinorhizobium meliloti]|nr:hypothetical protein [Sinorhizobium meliloti]MDW9513812.1 hypothetical protein [Sinorhizobium meliloti]
MRHSITSSIFAAGLMLLSWSAAAQEQKPASPLSASLGVQSVEIGEGGKETFSPAEAAAPGDLLQYTGRYDNVAKEPLSGLVINGPIPSNTSFVDAGRAVSLKAAFEVLIDGESWQGVPAYMTVTLEDGTKSRVEAEASDYRQIRWRVSEALAPGATLVTTYRVQVEK